MTLEARHVMQVHVHCLTPFLMSFQMNLEIIYLLCSSDVRVEEIVQLTGERVPVLLG